MPGSPVLARLEGRAGPEPATRIHDPLSLALLPVPPRLQAQQEAAAGTARRPQVLEKPPARPPQPLQQQQASQYQAGAYTQALKPLPQGAPWGSSGVDDEPPSWLTEDGYDYSRQPDGYSRPSSSYVPGEPLAGSSCSSYSRESAGRVARGWPPHQQNLQQEKEGRELNYVLKRVRFGWGGKGVGAVLCAGWRAKGVGAALHAGWGARGGSWGSML